MKSSLKKSIADILLVYAAAIWGTTFVIVKDSLNSIDAMVLVGYRFLFAAIVLGIILIILKNNLLKNIKEGFILGAILWTIYAPQTIGLKFTKASNSAFITGLFIIFVPLLSFFISREAPTKIKMFSVFLAISGLWILTGGLKEINNGDLLTLITAFACALHIFVASKFVKSDMNPYTLSFHQFFFTALFSFISAFVFRISILPTNNNVFFPIIFLALFPTLSAFVIQLKAQQFTSSIKVAIIFSLEPVFAALTAWLTKAEAFTVPGFLGGLFIVAAMLISELKSDEKVEKTK